VTRRPAAAVVDKQTAVKKSLAYFRLADMRHNKNRVSLGRQAVLDANPLRLFGDETLQPIDLIDTAIEGGLERVDSGLPEQVARFVEGLGIVSHLEPPVVPESS
jgi:hypothetical protein